MSASRTKRIVVPPEVLEAAEWYSPAGMAKGAFPSKVEQMADFIKQLAAAPQSDGPAGSDPLAQWKSRPSAEEIENHYPHSQHQPDECEMCRFIHDAAKAYVSDATSDQA